MAKRRYRPYRSRKQRSRQQMRNLALVLIVLIVGAVILMKFSGNENSPEQANGEEMTPISSILPESNNDASEDQMEASEPAFNPRLVVADEVEETDESNNESVPTENSQADQTPLSADEPEPVVETIHQISTIQTPSVDSGITSPEAQEFIDKANELRGNGKIIAARDLLNHTLDLKLSSVVRTAVKQRLAKLAEMWLLSPNVYESDKLTSYYLVQPRDLLSVIAQRHKVPFEILLDINGIERPELLQAGKKIKVVHGPFNAVIYKDSYTMDLYLQNVYVKTYRVGLGTEGHETPAGRWRVKPGGKLIHPRWTDPDTGRIYVSTAPDYPLGSRWIGIEGMDENTKDRTGFALHGTKDPDSIGTQSSRGCIRLFNGDVIEVYNMLREGVSEVLIVE